MSVTKGKCIECESYFNRLHTANGVIKNFCSCMGIISNPEEERECVFYDKKGSVKSYNKTKLLPSRSGYCLKINPIALERLENNQCPVCGKSKTEWTRRKDWTCCSQECTHKFNTPEFREYVDQSILRTKCLKIKDYKCYSCGKEAIEDYTKLPKWQEQTSGSSKTFSGRIYSPYNWIDEKGRPFILDHIIPIALGGDEFNLDNLQILCPDCNKIKTAKDCSDIASVRKGIRMAIVGQQDLEQYEVL